MTQSWSLISIQGRPKLVLMCKAIDLLEFRHWVRAVSLWTIVLSAMISQPLLAQFSLSPQSRNQDGFGLYGATVSGSYYDLSLSKNLAGPNGLGSYGSDFLTTTSVTVGWTRKRPQSTFSFLYSPTYASYARNSRLNRFNHSFELETDRPIKLSDKLTLSFSLSANVMDLQQFLFSAAGPGSLSGGLGYFNTFPGIGQSGAIQPGSVISPISSGNILAQNLIYGNRMLNATGQSTLTYNRSSRLSLSASTRLWRSQNIDTSSNSQNQNLYLVPETTTGGLAFTMAYNVSPRFQVGVNSELTRSFSRLLDAYNENTTAFLSSVLTRHWFVRADFGSGVYFRAKSGNGVPLGPQWVAGASIGYKTFSNTVMASYVRSISDYYGVGGNMSSVNAVWQWQRRGGPWTVIGGATEQRFSGAANTGLKSWYGNIGLSRKLATHTSGVFQYAYMHFSGPFTNIPIQFTQGGVLVSLSWTPQRPLF